MAKLANAQAFYGAAGRFREDHLRDGGAVVRPGSYICARAAPVPRCKRIVESPDFSEGEFIDKLVGGLVGAPAEAIGLAAEIL